MSLRHWKNPRTSRHLAESCLDNKLAAAKKDSVYYVAGQQRLQQPFTLFIRSDEVAQGDRTASKPFSAKGMLVGAKPLGQDAIDVLLKAAQPAPFGRHGEPVLDPEYRNALRLLPGTFGLSAALPTQDMMKDISSLMTPDSPPIFAQLDKLNIYGPGGMFKRHVDTPLNNCHFGSLVVALPCAFEGGELVVRNGGATVSLPLSGGAGASAGGSTAAAAESTPAPGTSTSAAPPAEEPADGPVLHFAAFFSDLEHEVLPVTSGYRITLTYNLFFDRTKQLLSLVRPLSGCYNPLVTELSRLLAQAAWHPEGVTLGYLLHHQYARNFRDVSDSMFPGVLKGVDRLLYAAMCETLGFQGSFRPVHLAEERGNTVNGDNLSMVFVGESFDRDMEVNQWYREEGELESLMREIGLERAVEMDVLWVGLRDTTETAFRLKSDVMVYGNDWSLSAFYSAVALLVELPPWHSPERERAIMVAERGG